MQRALDSVLSTKNPKETTKMSWEEKKLLGNLLLKHALRDELNLSPAVCVCESVCERE